MILENKVCYMGPNEGDMGFYGINEDIWGLVKPLLLCQVTWNPME